MPITKKECAWPECKNVFYGTDRKEFCGNTCKNKQWRLDKKRIKDKEKSNGVF